jgi:mono/diheme cytochrome c family protein
MIRQVLNRYAFIAVGLLLLASIPGWAQTGDPQRGEALYIGTAGFSKGGAPCLACHGIAGHELGYAAGATYGPDLTAMYEDYGEEGIADVLEDLSFESMVAIYESRPLTETEKADLVAFFRSVSTRDASSISSGLVLHVGLVTVFFMIIIGAFGWRRFQGVRQPLVARTRNEKGERV